MVTRVISGGQDGADVAGLRAAAFLGLETGGWMPAGYRTVRGPRKDRAEEYGLACTVEDTYPPRTKLNVLTSDATVRLAWDFNSPGERATLREIMRAGRPSFDVHLTRHPDGLITAAEAPAVLQAWLAAPSIRTLNVAGNASYWIEEFVTDYLITALRPGA